MKPALLRKELDEKKTYLITTTGGRKLIAKAIFGEEDWGAISFKIDRFESVTAQSVIDADPIKDYYYSPTHAKEHGCCSTDGIFYSEAVNIGDPPKIKLDDLILVATKTEGVVKVFKKKGDEIDYFFCKRCKTDQQHIKRGLSCNRQVWQCKTCGKRHTDPSGKRKSLTTTVAVRLDEEYLAKLDILPGNNRSGKFRAAIDMATKQPPTGETK